MFVSILRLCLYNICTYINILYACFVVARLYLYLPLTIGTDVRISIINTNTLNIFDELLNFDFIPILAMPRNAVRLRQQNDKRKEKYNFSSSFYHNPAIASIYSTTYLNADQSE